MSAGGGGAWKVAYADFVTAMMAFFMVMWLVGQKDDAKQAIASYFQDPYDDHAAHAGSNHHAPHAAKPKEKKGAGKPKAVSDDPHHPESKKSRILAIHGGERAAFGTVINFQGDSIEIDDDGKEQLELALPKFVGIPQKIEIRGHVSHQSAAKSDAWKLSYERSLAVMAYLVEHGIEKNRMRLAQAGAYEPLTITDTADAMARNSRVAVFLLEEFAEDTVGTPEERTLRHKEDAPSTEEKHGAQRIVNPKTLTDTSRDVGKDGPPADKHGHDDKKQGHGADKHGSSGDKHGHSAPPAAKASGGHH